MNDHLFKQIGTISQFLKDTPFPLLKATFENTFKNKPWLTTPTFSFEIPFLEM